MLRTIVVAALAAGTLALPAPVASAAEPVYDCSFDSMRLRDGLDGPTYTGVAFGFAVDADLDPVSIRCYITVNGAEVASPQFGATGPGFAVTYGTIEFAAAPEDDVDICIELNGAFAECFQGEHQQIPPQEIRDAVTGILDLADQVVCPWLASVGGAGFDILGLVVVDEDGDVYGAGHRLRDCPPYED